MVRATSSIRQEQHEQRCNPMNEIFLIQIKAKKLCHLKFFFEGEELMLRMKEGHTEMETISPTDTGNEGIKFVFKHGTKFNFFQTRHLATSKH